MTDTEFLDWVENHITSFRHSMREDGNNPFDMEWIDDEGYSHKTVGENIRHCINNALKEPNGYQNNLDSE